MLAFAPLGFPLLLGLVALDTNGSRLFFLPCLSRPSLARAQILVVLTVKQAELGRI